MAHDDAHKLGQIGLAALCYLNHKPQHKGLPALWHWTSASWKPADRRRNLVKAGALLRAEIERLQRLEEKCARELDAMQTDKELEAQEVPM